MWIHHSGEETPHMKMCSDACTKVGTPNTYVGWGKHLKYFDDGWSNLSGETAQH